MNTGFSTISSVLFDSYQVRYPSKPGGKINRTEDCSSETEAYKKAFYADTKLIAAKLEAWKKYRCHQLPAFRREQMFHNLQSTVDNLMYRLNERKAVQSLELIRVAVLTDLEKSRPSPAAISFSVYNNVVAFINTYIKLWDARFAQLRQAAATA